MATEVELELSTLREQVKALAKERDEAIDHHRQIRDMLRVFQAGLLSRSKHARTNFESMIVRDVSKTVQHIIDESLLRLPKREGEK